MSHSSFRAPSRRGRSAALTALLLALAGAQAQTPEPAVARFDVLEYRIEGNSVLPAERVERAVYPFLGEQRTVSDVESARAALETAYRDAGYGTVVVDTPEQKIVDGVVTLQVLQAPVARLRVVGARYYSQGRILDKVPGLAEGQVPNFKAVSEQLAGVNRSADRRVTPLLRPGKAPGTTEVDLTVEDRLPLHGSVTVNNAYSANTTRSRLVASLRYDNLWQREHSLGLQAQVSPEDRSEVKVFSASYTVPVGTGLLVASAIRSNSNTVAGVGGVAVFGRGSIYGLRRILVLDGSETISRSLTLGVDYKDFDESVSVGPNQSFDTPIRYLPFSARYATTLGDAQGAWQLGGGLRFAVRGLASRDDEFADKGYRAQSNFAILEFDVARTQSLPHGLQLFGKLDGQLSAQGLISNEQFVAGGVDSVRGYLEATAVGDKALHGSVELRTPNLLPELWQTPTDLRLHAFVDAAGLWLNAPLPRQHASAVLVGTGVGLRLQVRGASSLALDLGWPLHDAGRIERGDLRLHASGTLEF
ncbi:MAG TPA: ShlB/FhaC/HecB family hemolysin secretion/activation protein [Methylibium sp.]|nr:ShlB/FhaC/HecB family hemolysin secretion/activation protein [Methylibium sp.]